MTTSRHFSDYLEKIADLVRGRRLPVSVYRLNLNADFTFRDAASLAPYLFDLGISDFYLSPILKARTGSRHGYDVVDHNALNPELGSRSDFDLLADQLKNHDMGLLLDYVPNHMGMFENSLWLDVLENGPSSPFSQFFDIDWHPDKLELHGKVLLPVLEDLYGKVLASGNIILNYSKGSFIFLYRELSLPVDPGTLTGLLRACLDSLFRSLETTHPDCLELQSIITAVSNLPDRNNLDPEKIAERLREKQVILKRLGVLVNKNDLVGKTIQDTLRDLNGVPEREESLTGLHDLLEKQVYRLSCWRTAADEVNYRRFFDVNDLIAIRMEDPRVFDEAHQLVRELVAAGSVTGLRIDHIDGLFNPEEYLRQLQHSCWLDSLFKSVAQNPEYHSLSPQVLKGRLSRVFEKERENNPTSPLCRPLFIVVEKILTQDEQLPENWLVDGTTGYEFLASLNHLFIDPRHTSELFNIYRRFSGIYKSFDEIAAQSKNLVMQTTMAAELNLLAHHLDRVTEKSFQFRDFTLNSLRNAIREIIAVFPVYRTYIDAYKKFIDERDRAIITMAVENARRRNPALDAGVFELIKNSLQLDYPLNLSLEGQMEQRLFVMRFQQLSGPVMAKGIEDLALYVFTPLLSINEVGDRPLIPRNSMAGFHGLNRQRQKKHPFSLISTSTHDSKRSEDVRARLNVLSEIPLVWQNALTRWNRLNQAQKQKVDGEAVPDNNEEYLIYQTLLGTWPLAEGQLDSVYSERICQYLIKALREARVHSSWINPNIRYETAAVEFVRHILDPLRSFDFLGEFKKLLDPLAQCGIYNSLSQVVLKLFSPGVPDIYQGNELWDYALTDPDNRRPVDFALRQKLLKELRIEGIDRLALANHLRDNPLDGRIKLFVTRQCLSFRREYHTLFQSGEYRPLAVAGKLRRHICALA